MGDREAPTHQCHNTDCKRYSFGYHEEGPCPDCDVNLVKIGPIVELVPIDIDGPSVHT